MPRDKSDVVAALKKKGFENSKNTHHQYYTYRTQEGKLSKTKDKHMLKASLRSCALSFGHLKKLLA